VLTVTTDGAGRITRIEDLAGRTVDYGYTGSDLTSVTDTVGEIWTYACDSSHNLIGRSDPLGDEDTYAYDVHDRCYRHVDPTGAVESFSYTSRGSRAVLTDRRGVVGPRWATTAGSAAGYGRTSAFPAGGIGVTSGRDRAGSRRCALVIR